MSYADQLAPGTGERPLGRRLLDDSKVTDQHAIIPTTVSAEGISLTPDERKIYDLVCRRFLSAWHDDHIWSVTTVITAIRNPGIVDRYHTPGSEVRQPGWKVLDLAPPAKKGKTDEPQALLDGLAKDQPQDVVNVEVLEKKTRAPKRLTDATLLTALKRDFAAVRHLKPAASRSDSAELYLLATGFRKAAAPPSRANK